MNFKKPYEFDKPKPTHRLNGLTNTTLKPQAKKRRLKAAKECSATLESKNTYGSLNTAFDQREKEYSTNIHAIGKKSLPRQ